MNTVVIASASREFRLIVCYNCGVEFAVPKKFDETRLKDKSCTFFCPSGHAQHYATDIYDTLKLVRQDLADAITARDAAEQKIAAMTTRARNGICAFCKRTFANVARHVATKHQGGKQ